MQFGNLSPQKPGLFKVLIQSEQDSKLFLSWPYVPKLPDSRWNPQRHNTPAVRRKCLAGVHTCSYHIKQYSTGKKVTRPSNDEGSHPNTYSIPGNDN